MFCKSQRPRRSHWVSSAGMDKRLLANGKPERVQTCQCQRRPHWASAGGIGYALHVHGSARRKRMSSGNRSKGYSPAPSALGFGRWREQRCSGIGIGTQTNSRLHWACPDSRALQCEASGRGIWAKMPSALGIGPEGVRAVTLPLAALSRTPQQAGRPSPPSSPQTTRSVEERVSLTLADLSPKASEAAAAPATCPPSEWRGRTSRRGSTTKCHR